jgi:hypothetical protein
MNQIAVPTQNSNGEFDDFGQADDPEGIWGKLADRSDSAAGYLVRYHIAAALSPMPTVYSSHVSQTT